MRQYDRKDIDYETWYSPWMKQLAKSHTRADLELKLYGAFASVKSCVCSHSRAIAREDRRIACTQRLAQSSADVGVAGDTVIALRGALEIYDLFPEYTAAGASGGPQIAPVGMERAEVAPGHESAQTMVHDGSASGVSAHPSKTLHSSEKSSE